MESNSFEIYVNNADVALENEQYDVALKWYKKALAENPSDLYALSRAGATAVQLERFGEALTYFEETIKVDPNNGDNLFNLGNAYFFNEKYGKAFENYVKAESVGCSDDVKLQLYYQLMLICSVRQDFRSALVYLQKCADADESGTIVLNPDFISEKMKLYLITEDYDKAEECSKQMLAINPAEFRNYAVQFSLLMAKDEFDRAEEVLNSAEKYAEMNTENKVALIAQRASLSVAKAEKTGEKNFDDAINGLINALAIEDITIEQAKQTQIILTEVYYKAEQLDNAINSANSLLGIGEEFVIEDVKVQYEYEILDEIEEQRIKIFEKLENSGLTPESMYEINEDGEVISKLTDEEIAMICGVNVPKQDGLYGSDSSKELTNAETEQLYFILTSAYMAKEQYAKACEFAKKLKNSENKQYSYFGLYTETASCKYILEDKMLIEDGYNRAIAYFKSKMMSDYKDSLAALFRGRLYAEIGKYGKALEIAELLSAEDKDSLCKYVEECQENN